MIRRITIVIFLSFFSVPLWAQTQSLLKELNPAAPTAFDAGETVVYRITASCNNLTGGCGNLDISDTLPAQLEALSCNAPPSVTCVLTGGGTGFSIDKSPYEGGDTLAVTLTTRVRLGQDATSGIINVATATAGNVTNPTVNASAPPISINPGTPNWEVRKERIDPVGVDPVPGAQVTYLVQLCSVSGEGNVDLDNAVLVDTLPAGTTVFDANGGTISPGVPTTVTWNLGAIDLATLYGSNPTNSTQCIDRLLTIDVPSPPTANVGDPLINTADATITPQGQAGIGIGPAIVNDTLAAPVGNANLSKFGNDVSPSTGFSNIGWRPSFDTVGSSVPLTDVSFVDVLPPNMPGPAGPFDLARIRSGRWTAGDPLLGYQIVADLQTAPAPCGPTSGFYTTVSGGAGIGSTANALFTPGGDFPATDRCVRWLFRNIGSGPANEVPRTFGFETRPQIIQTVPASEPQGTVTNCAYVNLTASGGSPQTEGPGCSTVNIEPPTPSMQVNKTRVDTGQLQPLSEPIFRLSFNHVGRDSTGDIVNPVVADLLPANLEFVGWEDYSYSGPAAPQPYLTVTENYAGTGRTLVRFTWDTVVPAGALTFSGAPAAGGNPASFALNIDEDDMPDMDIRVRVRPGTTATTYTNELAVFHQGSAFTCLREGTVSVPDTEDLDVDGNTVEPRCQNQVDYAVVDAAVLVGEKWIQGDISLANVDDPSDAVAPPGGVCPDYGTTYSGAADQFTRFPCVAQTDHGGAFVYRARIQNAGNLNLDDYYLYDLLPFVGDTGSGGPLSTTARETRYRPLLTGPVVIESSGAPASSPIIEYTTVDNVCRPEVGYNSGCNPGVWVLAGAVADFTQVTAFRISDFSSTGDFGPLETIVYSVPMQAPASGAPPSIVGNSMIFNPSWNSFAHVAREARAGNNGPLLQVAEPPKVGIILPQRYRLGNLVWLDDNNNGTADSSEMGINGVQVSLCSDDDGTPGPSAGDSVFAVTTSATLNGEPGKYGFDTLPAGDYYAALDPNQPALNGLLSSTLGESSSPNDDQDNDDNGFGAPAPSCIGTALRSGVVTLGPTGTTEPVNEVLRAASAVDDDDDGSAVYADGLSNYSVDFGFSSLVDLGDLPDSSAGTGPDDYQTLIGNNGAFHSIVPGLRFGACNDAESDGQPSGTTIGDDSAAGFFTDGVCAVPGDDEDGINEVDLAGLSVFSPANIRLTASNQTAAAAIACGYIDFDGNGVFDAGEIASVSVPPGSNDAALTLAFGSVPSGSEGVRFARFRISTGLSCSAAEANGPAIDGEVEDYRAVIALPTGAIEVTKTVTGDPAPLPWDITISSSNCALPAPYDTTPTLQTPDGSGGTVTFVGLAVSDGAAVPADCLYDIAVTPQAGYTDTTAGALTDLTVTGGGTTVVGASCSQDPPPTGAIEVTKTVTGDPAPLPWEITISSSNCALPAPYNSMPTLQTLNGSGGTVTFIGLAVDDGAAVPADCLYDIAVTPQAGYTDTTSGSLTGLTVTDGGTTAVGASCTQDPAPTGAIEVTKTVTGDPAPLPWEITISSSNCALPAPYDTTPTLQTPDGSGGTVTFVGLAVDDGAAVPADCLYDIAVTSQAGYTDTTAGPLTGLTVTDGGTTVVGASCTQDPAPTGAIEVTKTVTGDPAPLPWEITISSSNCALPAPYDTTPTLQTPDGSGGTVTFVGLAVDDGAAVPADCLYDIAVTPQAGYTDTTSGSLTGLTVTDGGTTVVGASCTQDPTPTGSIGVTKTVTGDPAPLPWEITISSSNCTLPAPYDTTPTLQTPDGSGGTVTFVGLAVEDGAAVPADCLYDIAVTPQAGYTDTTTGSLTDLTVTDGGTTSVEATCEQAALFVLGDRVWYDNDQDGIQDGNELGANGLVVSLYENATCSGSPSETQTTTGNGDYLFTDLAAGDYCVELSPPTGWVLTLQNQGGDDATDSDADPATARIESINLNADDLDEDFGLYAATGLISGVLFCDDSPLNGAFDGGEEVGGVTMTLLRDGNCDSVGDTILLTEDTDINGEYSFTDLPVGLSPQPPNLEVCYTVTVDLMAPELNECSFEIFTVPPISLSTDNPESVDNVSGVQPDGPPTNTLPVPVDGGLFLLILGFSLMAIGISVKARERHHFG